MSIVAAVDFSDGTARVCDEAVRAARARELPVWLIHVAEPSPDFVGFEAGPDVVRDQIAHEFREEHRNLGELAEGMRSRGVEVTPLLIQGPIVETILEEADKHDAELIVMGSHGHGALYQILVGSISEGVLENSTRPILIVPVSD